MRSMSLRLSAWLSPPTQGNGNALAMCGCAAQPDVRHIGRRRFAAIPCRPRDVPRLCSGQSRAANGANGPWRTRSASISPKGCWPRSAPTDRKRPAREWAANRFATRLLLPGCWFAAAGATCDWDLPQLKQRFATASHELLARRMLEEPAPVIIVVCDDGRVTFRASNALPNAPPMSQAERTCWKLARKGTPARVNASTGAVVRGWPVHEPGWQREILRTDLFEAASDDWEDPLA